ncbi:hypothetical protein GCM10010377_69190 [Streptomyces viridiviolaceus]|nr:hypothetical protein GCM10010377_69190 [Streptomyces viridiviolaceus]
MVAFRARERARAVGAARRLERGAADLEARQVQRPGRFTLPGRVRLVLLPGPAGEGVPALPCLLGQGGAHRCRAVRCGGARGGVPLTGEPRPQLRQVALVLRQHPRRPDLGGPDLRARGEVVQRGALAQDALEVCGHLLAPGEVLLPALLPCEGGIRVGAGPGGGVERGLECVAQRLPLRADRTAEGVAVLALVPHPVGQVPRGRAVDVVVAAHPVGAEVAGQPVEGLLVDRVVAPGALGQEAAVRGEVVEPLAAFEQRAFRGALELQPRRHRAFRVRQVLPDEHVLARGHPVRAPGAVFGAARQPAEFPPDVLAQALLGPLRKRSLGPRPLEQQVRLSERAVEADLVLQPGGQVGDEALVRLAHPVAVRLPFLCGQLPGRAAGQERVALGGEIGAVAGDHRVHVDGRGLHRVAPG